MSAKRQLLVKPNMNVSRIRTSSLLSGAKQAIVAAANIREQKKTNAKTTKF
jgi:hypothetical protein